MGQTPDTTPTNCWVTSQPSCHCSGYDVMLDSHLQPHLLEVNSRPSIYTEVRVPAPPPGPRHGRQRSHGARDVQGGGVPPTTIHSPLRHKTGAVQWLVKWLRSCVHTMGSLQPRWTPPPSQRSFILGICQRRCLAVNVATALLPRT